MVDARRIRWDEEDKVLYDELRHSTGPFKNIELVDLFSLALAYGKQEGVRTPIGKKPEGRIRESTSDNTNIRFLMMDIAVEEVGNIDVLLDQNEYFTISEEYEKTGIKILYSDFKELGNEILDDMELNLIEFIEEEIEE